MSAKIDVREGWTDVLLNANSFSICLGDWADHAFMRHSGWTTEVAILVRADYEALQSRVAMLDERIRIVHAAEAELAALRAEHLSLRFERDAATEYAASCESRIKELEQWAQTIVALSDGWDEDGSTGPRRPLSWESVARLAMDYARGGMLNAAGSSPA